MLAEVEPGIKTVTAAKVAKIDADPMTALLTEHPRIAQAMYVAQVVLASVLGIPPMHLNLLASEPPGRL